MSPNDADGKANSVDPDQTVIWVCTICPGISIRKLRIITVRTKESVSWMLWNSLVKDLRIGCLISTVVIRNHKIRASSQENLSSGFATRSDSNRPAQLQRLARDLKFWI